MTAYHSVTSLLDWAPWQTLRTAWLATNIPNLPGLYRIRRASRNDVDYVGQTGSGNMTLRKRIGMLRGVYLPEMPYRDPHTAGPALWALRHATNCDFEVSVTPVIGTTPWRKGLECVAISLYRQERGASPTVNWGRMPPGYRMSSGNNAQLVAAGKRFRGGPVSEEDISHQPGIAPIGSLVGDPISPTWCGHVWSPWEPLAAATALRLPTSNGLYRIRRRSGQDDAAPLLYIGQGRISARLSAHLSKAGQSDHRQSVHFSGPIEYSFVCNETWQTHQRLELENDLIAAYILHTGAAPAAQFLG